MLIISENNEKYFFGLWIGLVALFLSYGIFNNNYLVALTPLIVPFAWWIINDYKVLLYLFFITVPFSIEFNFTASLGTDLPSEPIMWLMFGISIIIFANKYADSDFRKYNNPITLILFIHVSWILVTTITSEAFFLSLKILLAKLWYVIPFYFFSLHILKNTEDIKKLFRIGIVFLIASVCVVIFKHYLLDFEFDKINKAVSPIFRNHVSYACAIIVLLPYLWSLIVIEKNKNVKAVYFLSMLIFIVGIYFSYTRAAIISLFLCYPIYLVIKARIIKPILIATTFITMVGIGYLSMGDNYMLLTPDYNKTITHKEFGNLVSATAKGEDISTMERVYRWVAGVQMIKEKPMLGFGPGSFFSFYKGYTISSFQTYVSDNPDNSTVHNYYLLTFIEQGFIGFVIFICLCVITLVFGEEVYHNCKNKEDKVWVLAAMMSFIIILLINLINDMIETDKVGPFFFFSMAIIIFFNNKNKALTSSF